MKYFINEWMGKLHISFNYNLIFWNTKQMVYESLGFKKIRYLVFVTIQVDSLANHCLR